MTLNTKGYFTRSRFSREHHRRCEGRSRKRFEPDIDEAGVSEPIRYFVERVVAAARGEQQVESENRSCRRCGKIGVHDVIFDDHEAAGFERAKAFVE